MSCSACADKLPTTSVTCCKLASILSKLSWSSSFCLDKISRAPSASFLTAIPEPILTIISSVFLSSPLTKEPAPTGTNASIESLPSISSKVLDNASTSEIEAWINSTCC